MRNVNIEYLELLNEKLKRDCESSLFVFSKVCFRILHAGEAMQENWHIEYLCERLQAEAERVIRKEKKQKDLIINVPPRSLKSLIVSVIWPAWCWIKEPRLKFIGTSYSAILSTKHNTDTRTIIESEFYQRNWGKNVIIARDQNQKTFFQNTKFGIRQSTSTGGAVTGHGGNIIIVDDPVNPKVGVTKIELENSNKYFDETLSTRLNDPSIDMFVIVMQRLHDNDLTGHALKKNPEKYDHICIPAETTKDIRPESLQYFYQDNLFFPDRFSQAILNEQKINLGSYGYAEQYLQSPVAEEGGRIKKAWFRYFDMSTLEAEAAEQKTMLIWNTVFDGAFTEKEDNDPCGIMVYCAFENSLYIRYVQTKRLEFPDQPRFIEETARNNGYTNASRIFIECAASGYPALQTLKKQTTLNVIASQVARVDKTARLNSNAPFVEAGRCYLLRDAVWIDSFIKSVCSFPKAEHDEEVDLLCMAVERTDVRGGAVLAY